MKYCFFRKLFRSFVISILSSLQKHLILKSCSKVAPKVGRKDKFREFTCQSATRFCAVEARFRRTSATAALFERHSRNFRRSRLELASLLISIIDTQTKDAKLKCARNKFRLERHLQRLRRFCLESLCRVVCRVETISVIVASCCQSHSCFCLRRGNLHCDLRLNRATNWRALFVCLFAARTENAFRTLILKSSVKLQEATQQICTQLDSKVDCSAFAVARLCFGSIRTRSQAAQNQTQTILLICRCLTKCASFVCIAACLPFNLRRANKEPRKLTCELLVQTNQRRTNKELANPKHCEKRVSLWA